MARKNTLLSRSEVKVVDLLCEGEIEGFAPSTGILGNNNAGTLPYRSIYFDNVPILNKLGQLNYPMTGSYAVSFTTGSSGQAAIVGYENVEIPLPLPQNLEVKQKGEIITNPFTDSVTVLNREYKSVITSFNTRDYPEANYLKCNLTFPALYRSNSDGESVKESAAFEIFCSLNDGSRTSLTNGQIIVEGKTTYPYYKTVQVNLPTGSQQYNRYTITIERGDVDREDPRVNNRIFVESLYIGCRTKLKYPHTALAAWTFNSEQYGTTPNRKYEIKGLKVKIPNNYNPQTRQYTGNWNGTFATNKAWTQNPAWIYYDLVTNPRYGLGKYFQESSIDKWTLYEIAQYCDEMVDDGNGGREPRFTCNVVIYNEEDAFSLLQKFVSIFRGMIYWANGRFFVLQDSNKSPVYNFTNSNVVDGMFNYSSSAQNVRHTVALVRWTDPDNLYKESVEIVQDVDGILKYGYKETEILAFGSTSKGQAIRLGKWLLASEVLLTELVQFKTGLDGFFIKPGDIINIFDNDRLNKQQGGRVAAFNASRNIITLDRPIDILTGYRYNLSIVTPTGNIDETGSISSSSQISDIRRSQITTITLTGNPELNTSVVKASGSYPDSIYTGAIWVLDAYNTGNLALSTKSLQYKVLTVKESEKNTVEVFALDYNTGKFSFIETGYSIISVPTYTGDGSPINPPTNLVINLVTGLFDNIYQSYLSLQWTGTTSSNLSYYSVSGKYKTGAWELINNTPTTTASRTTSSSGYYYFNIRAVSLGGVYSTALSGDYFVSTGNPFSGPPEITGLEVIEDYDTSSTGYIGYTPTFGWSIITGAGGVEDARTAFLSGYRFSILRTGNNSLQYGPILLNSETTYYELPNNVLTGLPSGQQRAFRVLVQPYDVDGNIGTGISGIFNNSPLVGTSQAFYGGFGSIQYNINTNISIDRSGVIIWYTGTPFNPTFSSGNSFVSTNYAGTFSSNITGVHYIYYCPVDTFGVTGSYIYGPFTAAPATSYVSGLIVNNVGLGGVIKFTGSSGTNVFISGGDTIVINSPLVTGLGGMQSGIVPWEASFYMQTLRTGNVVFEHSARIPVFLTGYAFTTFSTINSNLSGIIFTRNYDNTSKTTITAFNIPSTSLFTVRGFSPTDIGTRKKIGIDLLEFPPEASGLSIGLFGYRVI